MPSARTCAGVRRSIAGGPASCRPSGGAGRGGHDLITTQFDHLAVAARDKQESATFLTDLLGLAEPEASGPWLSVTLDDGVRLDYADVGFEFPGQHYAILVSDDVFDRAMERIRASGRPFWPGPGQPPGTINTNHGGRGVYVDDPSGHHFELITRPYGSDL